MESWFNIGVAVVTILGIVGTWGWRLSTRLSRTDAKADAASERAGNTGIQLAGIQLSIDQLSRDMVEHRVSVAKEYVSNQTLFALEGKLITAIDRLGDRLDSLFQSKAPA